VAPGRKLYRMNEEQPQTQTHMQSFGRYALAAVVLVICAYILLHILFHVVVVVATILAVVVAIIGAIWAIRVLF
jgi:Flp pilus assembly protein TadB